MMRPPALRLHNRGDGFGGVDGRADNAVKLGSKIVPGGVLKGQVGGERGGIVDQNVKPPEVRQGIGHHRFGCEGVGQVGGEGEAADFFGKLLRGLAACPVMDNDAGPFGGEPAGNGGTDAAPCAGDKGDFTLQKHGPSSAVSSRGAA